MSWFNSIRQEYRDLSLHRKFSLILVLAILLPALFALYLSLFLEPVFRQYEHPEE